MDPISQAGVASSSSSAIVRLAASRWPRVALAVVRFGACLVAAWLFVSAGNNMEEIQGQLDFQNYYHAFGVACYGLAALSIGLGISTR